MKYWTTQEVAAIEGVTSPVAIGFAKVNEVKRLGTNYLWEKKDLEAFKKRNKTKGRPRLEDLKKSPQLDLF